MSRFLFPRWSNLLLPTILLLGAVVPLYVAFIVAYGFSPYTLEVGYQPTQPVPVGTATTRSSTLGSRQCRRRRRA